MAKGCTSANGARAIEIDGGSAPRVRRSRVGRWRALALIAVHVVIALHFLHWFGGKSTLTPVEPSESMQFSTSGVINAGLVFFALAIGSTLVLGRFVCGWSCHLVALQDLCGWLLTRVGLKPKPVRLGVLGVVPWLAFVYMFVAPIVARLMAGESITQTSQHFFTEDLWRTFPHSVWEALVTIAVVGFLIVWLLGAKGFCTYGCPYGGIFGVADQLAPLRIRVNDACEGCGHCSAVCTSNVNVAREVREYGMVVDPGCMKCLDCVSVCPNDALRVGWGVPALFARARGAVAEKARGLPWARWALLAAFVLATTVVLQSFDGVLALDPRRVSGPETALVLWLAGGAFLVAVAFRGRARRPQEYSLGEEALLAAAFLVALLSFRGLFGGVALLFALGLSAILAWALVQGLRLLAARDVKLQRIALKSNGRWSASGAWFAIVLVPVIALWTYGFRTQSHQREAAWYAHHWPALEAEARPHLERGIAALNGGRVDEGIAALRRALEIDPRFSDAREPLVAALIGAHRASEVREVYERALADFPADADTLAFAARAMIALNDRAAAIGYLERAVRAAPEREEIRRFLDDVRAGRERF